MKNELNKHRLAYLSLALGLAGFVVMFLGVWPSLFWQRITIIGLAVFYFIWGVLTHVKTDHITRRVVYEYLGYSVLAGVLLIFVTL